jgi:hypothetical protein
VLLAAQAAQLVTLVGRQVAGLAPAGVGIRLAQPMAQRLGRDAAIGGAGGQRPLAAPREPHGLRLEPGRVGSVGTRHRDTS